MEFPERIYTVEEVKRARELINKGFKHDLKVIGGKEFKQKVEKAILLIKEINRYDFLRTYIRRIVEVDGFSQLREAEAAIWMNKYMVEEPVNAASFIIQKVWQMKNFIEGKINYGTEETRLVRKRIEFLEKLREESKDEAVRKKCNEILKQWEESSFL